MDVQLSPAKLLGNALDRAEIDHVERTDGKHIRNLRLENRIETRRTARQHAPHNLIRDLGGRDVEHPLDQPGLDQLFHCLAARPRGVEHQAVEPPRLERFTHRRDTRSRHAEHRHSERPLAVRLGRRVADHARDRGRRVAKHPPRHRIEPGNVDDRVHQRDVARADIRRGVPAGDRRDHHLGQTDRQRPHGRRDERSAPASADSDHPGKPSGIVLAAAGKTTSAWLIAVIAGERSPGASAATRPSAVG